MDDFKLKRIKRSMDRTPKTLQHLDGYRRRKERGLEPLPAGDDEAFQLVSERVREIAAALQDETLARRVVKLLKDYPYGTVPEMIMLDYMQRLGVNYKYQAQLFGGYRSGGLVPDFVVSRNGTSRALLIQGQYWHNIPGKREKDAADKLRMLGSYFDGEQITDVVFIWESRLMSPNREEAMDAALLGQDLGA